LVGESPDPLGEGADRDAFNRIEIDRRQLGNRIGIGFEDDFAGESSDPGGARSDQSPSKTRYCRVAAEDDDGSAPYL
jgi:hypothetical protein